ncbi:MAG: T9SS type A sorting domain-containing protein [Flavobacteriaceae bacterium]
MTLIRFFTTLIFLTFSYQLAAQAPTNDNPANAIELTVQTESCSGNNTATAGTFANATHSGETYNSIGCTGSSVTNPVDLWYKVETPSSGRFGMYADGDVFSGEPSLTAVFFTESGGVYTRFDCSDDVYSTDPFEISGRSSGELIFIQVLSNDELWGYGSDLSTLEYDICAYHPDGTLDLSQTQKPLLLYYSNPVGNRLSVESHYQIETLRVFDLTGKQVLHKTPNQQKLTLNTFTLAQGAYLLRVETPEGQQTVKLIKK